MLCCAVLCVGSDDSFPGSNKQTATPPHRAWTLWILLLAHASNGGLPPRPTLLRRGRLASCLPQSHHLVFRPASVSASIESTVPANRLTGPSISQSQSNAHRRQASIDRRARQQPLQPTPGPLQQARSKFQTIERGDAARTVEQEATSRSAGVGAPGGGHGGGRAGLPAPGGALILLPAAAAGKEGRKGSTSHRRRSDLVSTPAHRPNLTTHSNHSSGCCQVEWRRRRRRRRGWRYGAGGAWAAGAITPQQRRLWMQEGTRARQGQGRGWGRTRWR